MAKQDRQTLERVALAAKKSRADYEGSASDWLAERFSILKSTPGAQAVAATRLLMGNVDIPSAAIILPALGFTPAECAELLAEQLGYDLELVLFMATLPTWEQHARLLRGRAVQEDIAEGYVRWMELIRTGQPRMIVPGARVRCVRPDLLERAPRTANDKVRALLADERYVGIVIHARGDVAIVAWEDDVASTALGVEDLRTPNEACWVMHVWRMDQRDLVLA